MNDAYPLPMLACLVALLSTHGQPSEVPGVDVFSRSTLKKTRFSSVLAFGVDFCAHVACFQCVSRRHSSPGPGVGMMPRKQGNWRTVHPGGWYFMQV